MTFSEISRTLREANVFGLFRDENAYRTFVNALADSFESSIQFNRDSFLEEAGITVTVRNESEMAKPWHGIPRPVGYDFDSTLAEVLTEVLNDCN